MRISQQGLDLIASFEELELKAYRCPAGVLTIGYGHTRNVRVGQAITKAQAMALLRDDIRDAEAGVTRLCEGIPVTQGQFDALVSFAFNCGVGALKASTMLKKVRVEDFEGAAFEFSKWNKADGKILPGLTRCRQAEAALFLG